MLDRITAAEACGAQSAFESSPDVDAASLNDREFATTLARGLCILRSFTRERPALGNRDLVERTGLPKATVSRFTYTLCRLGYLRQLPGQPKYQLASGILSLGYPLLASMRLRQLARRQMDALACEVQGSVAIGVRNGLNMVCVESSIAQSGASPPYTHIGYEHPIVVTSMGHAWLAASTALAREATLNQIRIKQPALWRRYGQRVETSLRDHARRGFCLSLDSWRPGIYGVSVPFPRLVQDELVVFNCTVYAHAVTPARLEAEVAPRLVALVQGVDAATRAAEENAR